MDQLLEGKYSYYAFISYKREDEEWAKWLQHKLEHYRLPSNLNGRTDLPKEIRPVFKDTSELTPGNLPDQINLALEQSKYLIVICSPRSAQSEWVNKEVETFMSMGKIENIIPFIIDGRPFSSNSEEECFPQAILSLPQEQEILGANINEMGRDAAAVKVVARMFDIRFDELWQRHEREQKRRRNIIILSVAVFVMAVVGTAFWMYLQQQKTLKANWEMMENQARMVAEKSKEEIKKGNTYDAILALLEMAPQDGSRPFVPELEEALRVAYDSLQSQRWNYRYLGKQYRITYFSDDCEYIVGNDRDIIDIYETKSLKLISEIQLPDYQKDLISYLSSGNDTLYVLDNNYIISYHIPDGNRITEILYTKELLRNCMGRTCKWNPYEDYDPFAYKSNQPLVNLQWVKEWKKNVGIPDEARIIDFNPKRNLVFLQCYDSLSANRKQYYNVIYDCTSEKSLVLVDEYIEDDSTYWANEKRVYCASFSPSGNELTITYHNGKGILLDINDMSWQLFDDTREEDKWIVYGYNGQIIEGSARSPIKIYDENSYTLIDSLSRYETNEIVQINKEGTVCMVGPNIYYRRIVHEDTIKRPSKADDFKLVKEIYGDSIAAGRYVMHSNGGYIIRFKDLMGEIKEWKLSEADALYGEDFYYIQDNNYILVGKIQGHQNVIPQVQDTEILFEVIHVPTGYPVYHFPRQYGDCFYSQASETIAWADIDHIGRARWVEDDCDFSFVLFFPSFDHLVSLCRKATQGMVLTEYARRKFYLNNTSTYCRQ